MWVPKLSRIPKFEQAPAKSRGDAKANVCRFREYIFDIREALQLVSHSSHRRLEAVGK